ncbi:MAG: hypothetical protein L6Q97_18915 [Thermoanaerobaculia bacterium]|nr:hypothetical protein [Thermoanaerobaculia bacterium]
MFQQNVLQGPGTGTFTTHTFEILLMLVGAFLFGLWFGWILWSRYRQTAEKLRLDNESLNASLNALRAELDGLKVKLSEAENERTTLAAQAQNLGWELDNARSQILVLQSDMGKIQERNRQLESELALTQPAETAGSEAIPLEVETPQGQAEAELVELERAAAPEDTAGETVPEYQEAEYPEEEYEIADAMDVPESRYTAADAEQWLPELPPIERKDEAVTMIPLSELVAPTTGQEGIAETATAEPREEPFVVAAVTGPRDDLKIVEGIGPKIEELLFKAGITTYGQLAATSVQQLKDILTNAGPRFVMHDPGTWSAQALLAANGEWDNLKAYQDFLNAGKRPEK